MYLNSYTFSYAPRCVPPLLRVSTAVEKQYTPPERVGMSGTCGTHAAFDTHVTS